MRQPHQPPLPNTTLQIGIAPKTEPLVVVYAYAQLPPEELEVVNLLFYEGLTPAEAANVLGISFRTLKRRWQSAKLNLYKELTSE